MYEATGRIKLIEDTQSFPSGFTKREFVVTTGGKFPQDLKFEVVKDKCSVLDNFEAGQDVTVNFDIRGNEFKGKYYVNLSCWKLQAGAAGGDGGEESAPPAQRSYGNRPPQNSRQPAQQSEPSPADLRNEDDFDDDIPF